MKSTKRKNKITKNPKETEKAVNRRKKWLVSLVKSAGPLLKLNGFACAFARQFDADRECQIGFSPFGAARLAAQQGLLLGSYISSAVCFEKPGSLKTGSLMRRPVSF